MTPELAALALAGLLQAVQFVLMAVPANRELGPERTMGPRDEPLALSGMGARLKRAMDNHFEGLILFTLAVVVVTLSGASSGFTAACAWTYLAARVAYVPCYAYGLAPWRSIVWTVGFAATLAMILAALLSAPARAQERARIEPGAFVMIARSNDRETGEAIDRPAPGEETACFEVLSVGPDGARLRLVSGAFLPYWSDEPMPADYEDLWFSSTTYLRENPGAGILDELHTTFRNVPSC